MTRKNHYNRVWLICPTCNKSYYRRFDGYYEGYGFCNIHTDVRLIIPTNKHEARRNEIAKKELNESCVN